MQTSPWDTPEAVERDLSQRLAAVSDSDTTRGMFFLGVLDAVRFLGGESAVTGCLAQAGEQRDFVPMQTYPIGRFLKLAYVAGHQLAAQFGGFEDAMRRIGTQATLDFLNSMFAREFVAQAGGDPKKLLDLLHSGYRTALSFGERSVEWTGPRSGRVLMKRSIMPIPYNEGVLRGALEMVGARDVQVTGRVISLDEAVYDTSWDD
ncbi:TIGR02265 family protein [Corallococcus sp. H22C18031201]|uniref:TIGR02265 family protein n=1 Tax=Citreicoccus inhibens TaxID=2849499 RepID=UPI000E749322|nr:TIGR02265 family protein [Citreicoccus inhibens]MBU8897281.1 DUF2378 family protein [Citreicoccus inhibens]RJS21158.1 TIGR02265 family protein [Corallococcus sp. H22C18031201]